jgi:hypothetical protein
MRNGQRRRGQATLEYLALLAAILALLGVLILGARTRLGQRLVSAIGSALHVTERHGDRWAILDGHYGRLARLYLPDLVLERDRYGEESSVPVDFTACRALACAAYGTGRPAIYVHVVDQPGRTYIEYWFYYPDSRTSHGPGVTAGYHLDDWEGAIVRVDDDGGVYGRVSTHGGFSGARPYWTGDPGWRPISAHPVIYRAAGSHGNGFGETGIDLAGDNWNGTLGQLAPSSFSLLAGDEAPSARRRFADDATPPWTKLVWTRPETTTTSDNADPGWRTRAAGAVGTVISKLPKVVTAGAGTVIDAVPPVVVEGATGVVDGATGTVAKAGRGARHLVGKGIDSLRGLP